MPEFCGGGLRTPRAGEGFIGPSVPATGGGSCVEHEGATTNGTYISSTHDDTHHRQHQDFWCNCQWGIWQEDGLQMNEEVRGWLAGDTGTGVGPVQM